MSEISIITHPHPQLVELLVKAVFMPDVNNIVHNSGIWFTMKK